MQKIIVFALLFVCSLAHARTLHVAPATLQSVAEGAQFRSINEAAKNIAPGGYEHATWQPGDDVNLRPALGDSKYI